ncbi:VPS29 [Candida pseudojiufengensis]|uniref:VPS29 n=1 Tax=Candida pseudojiufengensis TaxID=497109 RepID=UPI00222437B3|nr:VPS29 [Candida pseudojiufengensis]KAI5966140.1 VPS29 [Candida pseudojiufengensis]
MLTLAIGDLFIPERTIDLPPKFKKLLAPNPNNYPSNPKINKVLCLGNITNSSKLLKFLYDISLDFQLTKGEFDNPNIISQQLQFLIPTSKNKKNELPQIPMYNKFNHDNLKIGYTNGYQIVPRGDPLQLSSIARELDVDILIWGGTHRVEAYTLDGKFFINPGSGTGAFSLDWPELDDEEEEDIEREEEVKKESSKEDSKEKGETKSNEDTEEESKDEPKQTEEDLEKAREEKEKEILFEVTEMNTNIPSFCLLDTNGSTCILYIYTYFNNEVKVDKVTYSRE